MHQIIEGYRLSLQQILLWRLQQQWPEKTAWQRAECVIQIDGAIEPESLRLSLERVVARHEILRTQYESLAGMDFPLQVIHEANNAIDWTVTKCDQESEDLLSKSREYLCDKYSHTPSLISQKNLCAVLSEVGEMKRILWLSLNSMSADASTLENLLREIRQEYENLSAIQLGNSSSADTALQYVQFSEWQAQLSEDEDSDEARHFWRTACSRSEKVFALSFENKQYNPDNFEPVQLRLEATPEAIGGIISLAERYSVSMKIVLQACWHIWLYKVGVQSDLCVQSLFNGRKYQDLNDVLGPMAQFIPIHTHIEDEYCFKNVLQIMNQVYQSAQEWEEYFDPTMLFEASSITHMLPVQYEFEQVKRPIVAAGFSFTKHLQWVPSVPYKLKFSCAQIGEFDDGNLQLNLHYNSSLYSRSVAEVFARQFLTLISAAAANPEVPLASLDLLSPEDRECLISYRHTPCDYPDDSCIQQIFERQAELMQDRTAVIYGNQQLSYRELNERANQLAHYLHMHGVGSENIVALYLNRSVEMIIGILGTLKAGAAYLPLDLNQPESRLRLILNDANASIVLTTQSLDASWVGAEKQIIYLDTESELISQQSAMTPLANCLPGNLAYLIYTSGTSGSPKAVMIQHGSILNLAMGLRHTIYREQSAPLRVSINAPMAFDGSVKQWVQLLSGHSLDILPEEVRSDGERLIDYLQEHKIDVLDCTPSHMRLLLQAGISERQGEDLKIVLVGGEGIDELLWMKLNSNHAIEYFNVYGPTECTVDSTVCHIGPDTETPSIGRSLPNIQAYILNACLNLAPVGVQGDLYIGGGGLSRGYFNRPDLTAEKFIPNLFGQEGGGRLYQTGDLTQYLPDGSMEFLGRSDYQIKLRGYRMELGEIESVLCQHPAVQESVVIAKGDISDDLWLAAYVVLDRKQAATIQGHRRYELPNGMAVVHQNKNETDYLYHEIFEKQIYLNHGITLDDNACVFDVGANIGMFTFFVSRTCVRPRIYSFEPLRPIFDVLSINTDLYVENVKLYNFGLSDTSCEDIFTYYPKYSMMSGIKKYADPDSEIEVVKSFIRNEQRNGAQDNSSLLQEADDLLANRFQFETHTAQLKTLSEVIREENIEQIDLIKIDVQRAELDVLNGIAASDWAKIQQIVMEVHDTDGNETAGRIKIIEALLRSHKFAVWIEQDELLEGTDRYNLYARKEALITSTNGAPHFISEHSLENKSTHRIVNATELKSYLRERLPEFMVPSVIVQLEALPLTRNGKVDRTALPAPELAMELHDARNEQPLTLVQELLANIWSDVLRIENVGLEENFFELGGHSLLATLLISRIRSQFQIELPLRVLFERPTIATLSEIITSLLQTENSVIDEPIIAIPRDGFLPLSFAQQRLWFLTQLEPDSPFYNVRHHLLLKGKLDITALERTLNEVIRRHESLRTNFIELEGNPVQVIAPERTITLQVMDLSDLDSIEHQALIRTHASDEVRKPFDLKSDPLMRVKLLRLSNEEHALLYTMHHLISDGWSSSVMMKEVASLYKAYTNGEPSPLADLPLQYADFAAWQRQYLQGSRLEWHLDYWREQLADLPSELALPADRPRPLRPTFNSGTQLFRISEGKTSALRALSRREGTTMFMTMLSVFQTLLYRYTGQEDILIGSPIANRNRAEVENIIGFFINTLVLRIRLSGNPTFYELLRIVRDTTLKAYAHQDLPFEKLVQEIHVRRDLNRTPLFQVLMVFQNIPHQKFSLPGLTISEISTEDRWSNFDLTLWMTGDSAGLTGVLEYNADLFNASTIQRMAAHFQLLLNGILNDPSQRISNFPLIDDIERDVLLSKWNNIHQEYSSEDSFIKLFESQVRLAPAKIAISDENDMLSYEELNCRSNRLAHSLINTGIVTDMPVGLLLERSVKFLISKLGVLKAGGAMLLIDPRSPVTRLQQILECSDTKHLLVEREMMPLVGRIFENYADCDLPQVLVLEDIIDKIADSCFDRNPGVNRDPGQLSYIIYTSGSTGIPKGAMIEDRGMLNHLYAKINDLQFKETDIVAQTAPQCFDISVWQFLSALLIGGRIEVFDDNIAFDGIRLWTEVARRGVSVLEIVPSLLQVMIETEEAFISEEDTTSGNRQILEKGTSFNSAAGSLRWLLLTGEALQPYLCQRWIKRHPHIRVLNAYGPTECSDDVTHYEITEPLHPDMARMPIGNAINNMRLYVVDSRLQLLSTGMYGELLVGGIGVGRGYLGDAWRTSEVFSPDSYNVYPGRRIYHTGDIVRWLDEGVLEYVGRIDQQVKLRGNRIELGEIEGVLVQHHAIQEAVADIKTDSVGERCIVAYVVCTSEESLNVAELRAYLKDRLPGYMIPLAYIQLERIPLTRNGKVDRRALPNPISIDRTQTSVPPRNYEEEIIAGIWKEVLKTEVVSVHDNFFELGGHSLLATQVISRIRITLQVDLPLRNIFEQPTIAALAALVTEAQINRQQREDLDILNQLDQFSDEEVELMLNQISVEDLVSKFNNRSQTLES